MSYSPPNPSPTSPLSPSWPMFSAPSSPMPTSSTSSDSSPIRSVAGFVWFSVAAFVLSLAWSFLHAVFSLLVNFVPHHPNLHLLFDRPEEAVHEDSRLLFSNSTPFRKAKALYACKAEHDSELSFTAGTVFDNGEFLIPIREVWGRKTNTGVFKVTPSGKSQ
ncbi:Rho GTPase-activating protein 26 [Galemys pyrenaicus]|uniref:Rho GTPase-activating protein 26 n=1 Tax=Galemys pyrenaicus TaxID=202257 RepID=A0A8J5ZUK0_GALPY|nr:Rho GTPase-activating protein 26 [Galemys pyrenaicus]